MTNRERSREIIESLRQSGMDEVEVYLKTGRSRRFEMGAQGKSGCSSVERGWAIRAGTPRSSTFVAGTGLPEPTLQLPPPDGQPLRLPPAVPIPAWQPPSDLDAALVAESEAMVFARLNEPTLAIVAGRQLVTREGLELLALATGQELASGRSLTDSVRATLDVGGIPVLPWGFGKWWFQRGNTVRDFLQTEAETDRKAGED